MLYREERLAAQIRDELSRAILKEMEFPGALPTITEVELNQKRDVATVHVSVLPDEQADHVVGRLNGARGMLRHLLIKPIPIRLIPELVFKADRGLQNAAAVEAALLKAQEADKGGETEKEG